MIKYPVDEKALNDDSRCVVCGYKLVNVKVSSPKDETDLVVEVDNNYAGYTLYRCEVCGLLYAK